MVPLDSTCSFYVIILLSHSYYVRRLKWNTIKDVRYKAPHCTKNNKKRGHMDMETFFPPHVHSQTNNALFISGLFFHLHLRCISPSLYLTNTFFPTGLKYTYKNHTTRLRHCHSISSFTSALLVERPCVATGLLNFFLIAYISIMHFQFHMYRKKLQ